MIPNSNRNHAEITVYKPSSDDWYCSYEIRDTSGRHFNSGCSVSIYLLDRDCFTTGDIWCVTVGGAGNHCVVKEFCNYEGALSCFMEVLKLEDVTLEILVDYMQFTGEY